MDKFAAKSRVPSDNEMKALSSSDKTEKNIPRGDTAPVKMVKPNKTRVEKPLTPPEEKRSVSFDLSTLTLAIPNDVNTIATSPSESIDIPARELSQDIMVALVERDTEMRELFICNQDFFDMVKQSTFEDDDAWNEFLELLYSKREDKPDSEWMNSISESLSANPPLLVTFKQIIGFYDDDDTQQEFEDSYSPEISGTSNDEGFIDITPIRGFPKIMENLEKSYPQFFINAKNILGKERQRRGSVLGGNHLLDNDNPLLHPNIENHSPEASSETLYEEFKRILLTPRSEMDDNEWETAIYECLDPWPQLICQLEDIILYEISEE
ncbi:10977_t:CDS:1 [Funneliformis geosporum]|uniref:18190_t:CDS:1 n=1 Tax=Funneliformis geosporum TaxID=1117311 RepID=A0A9W4SM93_9GLOM|nr:10977_t:CDS:1 [Funneliformis geosporum]CAI2174238.1 18190_t:CDS:1 [Funneliformis geosporum]